ncbi:TadE/TadG family type IV pilus assembly protein [Nesterenkonia jeotgali]|uniref:TadE/TadG family type IV pilus assembly protein n=1 Tax=Nesterenkonia jeotgali TaxID=317018 RepID=UPI000A59EA1F|nr:TadE/TadG family type IV pilus assembly protein [Nesterenkonia jeotgali]
MRSPSERGSISAEFALALPSVVLVLLLVLSLGLHGAAQVSLEAGAGAAARELARGQGPRLRNGPPDGSLARRRPSRSATTRISSRSR